MKKIIAIALTVVSLGAQAQQYSYQQQGNTGYLSDQRGHVATFQYRGNQTIITEVPRFVPTPLDTTVVPVGGNSAPAPVLNYDTRSAFSGGAYAAYEAEKVKTDPDYVPSNIIGAPGQSAAGAAASGVCAFAAGILVIPFLFMDEAKKACYFK